jgi:hypothetical protein
MIKSFSLWKEFIEWDLFRYSAERSWKAFVKSYMTEPGFKYSFLAENQ